MLRRNIFVGSLTGPLSFSSWNDEYNVFFMI